MAPIRKKSTLAFSICSFATSLLFSLLVFADGWIVVIPLVVSATVLAGSFGFIFGNSFASTGPKSKYKAMLFGAVITAITFIFSFLVSIIALKISTHGFNYAIHIDTYLSEIILSIGISGAVAGPVLLPLGAVIGIYVKNSSQIV